MRVDWARMTELGLTLVCHYGVKPAPLAGLLQQLVDFLAQRWGSAFEAYSLGQMHATLIGLETDPLDGLRVNRWFWQHRGERRVPDAERLSEVLENTRHLPVGVRFGGFRADGDYPLASRGQHPYQRSFQCQGEQVVLMGWPERGGAFPSTLAELRREFESANLLHKYHADPERDADNDLFMVLGRIDRGRARTTEVAGVELEVRELLARTPTRVDVDREALSLVAYTDPTLPESACQRWRPEAGVLRGLLA